MTAWTWGKWEGGVSCPDCLPERTGEPDQMRRWKGREGAGLPEMACGFLYAGLKGPVLCPQANVQQRHGNVAVIPEKRLVTETWESADRTFGRAASAMAHSPGCWSEGLGTHHWLPERVHNMAAHFPQSE